MDMDFCRKFVLIAEEKSIAKAAERLFISRTALNRQLLQCEAEIGMPLFKRMPNALELTYAGSIFLESANEVIRSQERCLLLLTNVNKNINGRIVFGASSSVCSDILQSVLPDFYKEYPGIRIVPYQADHQILMSQLQQGKLDVAVVSSPLVESDNRFLEYEELTHSEVHLAVSKNHPMAKRAGVGPDGRMLQCDLNWFKEDLFCLQSPNSPIFNYISQAFQKAGFTPKVCVENTARSISLPLVQQGIACAFLADFKDTANLQSGPLARFGLNPRIYYSLSVAYVKGYELNDAEKYFIDLIKRHYGK